MKYGIITTMKKGKRKAEFLAPRTTRTKKAAEKLADSARKSPYYKRKGFKHFQVVKLIK